MKSMNMYSFLICACALIAFGYILQAPEGLRLPSMTANVISVIATAVIAIIFIKKYKK